jgi:hypothetical protein
MHFNSDSCVRAKSQQVLRLQVPLEVILKNDPQILAQMKPFLENRRLELKAKGDAESSGGNVGTGPNDPTAGYDQFLESSTDGAVDSDGDSDATVRSS